MAKSNSGKFWLILDLRYVNKNAYKNKTKFDDWKIMEEDLGKEAFLFKFDIKQGYHHININENHQNFLGF